MTKDDLYNKYPSILPRAVELSVASGWYPILDELCGELVKAGHKVVLEQCKEKFGGLRFYVSWEGDDSPYAIIRKFENKSYSVCEGCGKPGALRGGGWIRTLCNVCAEGKPPLPRGFFRQDPKHLCPGWNVCPECRESSCSEDSLSCYDCNTWRHKEGCAQKHIDETGHKGQLNDLVFVVKAML